MRAIRRYSRHRVQLVPDELALGGLNHFTEALEAKFMDFDPPGEPCVHSHVMPWFIRWCRRQQQRGLRWFHTYHLPYFPEHGRGGLEPWQEEINKALIEDACHADVRLSVSRWQQRYLRQEHGIETEYLPNGVDVPACEEASAARFLRNFHIEAPFLLFVGRNTPVKNPADFVRLSERLQEVTCVMIGDNLSPRALHDDWDVAVGANLHVLGALPHATVQDAIAASRALVITSLREGLPTLALEALVQGKPVVVPDDPGCMEAVGDGRFGTVYRSRSVDDLVEVTQTVLDGTEYRPEAREYAIAEYSWEGVISQLDDRYAIASVRQGAPETGNIVGPD